MLCLFYYVNFCIQYFIEYTFLKFELPNFKLFTKFKGRPTYFIQTHIFVLSTDVFAMTTQHEKGNLGLGSYATT